MRKGAFISPCGRYRPVLWRAWPEASDPVHALLVIGLNPSTADAQNDDPTIRRCIGFAKSWRYNALWMMNLYSYRATSPADMFSAEAAGVDAVGPDNDFSVGALGRFAGDILVAWGSQPRTLACQKNTYELLTKVRANPLYCLGTTKNGSPRHPLYVKADTPLEVWIPPWL